MGFVIIGALVGAAIAWLIATIRGPRFRHLGGGWFEEKPAKMGCFSHLILTIVLAAIGALIGAIVGDVF